MGNREKRLSRVLNCEMEVKGQPPLSPHFVILIKQILEVDSAAAVHAFRHCNSHFVRYQTRWPVMVSDLFTWSLQPQGRQYWKDLHQRIHGR